MVRKSSSGNLLEKTRADARQEILHKPGSSQQNNVQGNAEPSATLPPAMGVNMSVQIMGQEYCGCLYPSAMGELAHATITHTSPASSQCTRRHTTTGIYIAHKTRRKLIICCQMTAVCRSSVSRIQDAYHDDMMPIMTTLPYHL